MANFPTQGQSPWGDDLKEYIDEHGAQDTKMRYIASLEGVASGYAVISRFGPLVSYTLHINDDTVAELYDFPPPGFRPGFNRKLIGSRSGVLRTAGVDQSGVYLDGAGNFGTFTASDTYVTLDDFPEELPGIPFP